MAGEVYVSAGGVRAEKDGACLCVEKDSARARARVGVHRGEEVAEGAVAGRGGVERGPRERHVLRRVKGV